MRRPFFLFVEGRSHRVPVRRWRRVTGRRSVFGPVSGVERKIFFGVAPVDFRSSRRGDSVSRSALLLLLL
jgi:hypothetical protein